MIGFFFYDSKKSPYMNTNTAKLIAWQSVA